MNMIEPWKLRRMKKKHPKFFRSNYGRRTRKRVADNWRRPRGIDNKKREKRSYVGREVNIGHRNPRRLRNIHPSGYEEVCVENVQMLEGLKGVAIRIAGAVGAKKREQIKAKAREMGLRVLN